MQLKDIINSEKELYVINFEHISYVFRLLSLGEFDRFNKLLHNNIMAPFFLYEEIFNLCSDYKYEYINSNVVAGHAVSIGNLIYELSGNKDGKDFLIEIAQKREELKSDSISAI